MRRRGRGGSRRGRRMTGMREAALLLLLHRDRAHGYTLVDRLEEFGLAEVAPSVVYRVLRDMEAQGWVQSAWDDEEAQGPPRRVYRLTSAGDEVLAEWVERLDETRKQLGGLVQAYRAHMEEGVGDYH
jgi:PadR family transcriptional regulator PadR